MNSLPSTLIVMGVSGSGKSLIGKKLAEALQAHFEDADDLHPPENKAKMAAGTPLNDDDRQPWLERQRRHIVKYQARGTPYVLACSALKKKYRDLLRGEDDASKVQFIYLHGSKDLIGGRMQARKGHFMPTTLLDSQFATLEQPDDTEALQVNIDATPDEIVQNILQQLQSSPL